MTNYIHIYLKIPDVVAKTTPTVQVVTNLKQTRTDERKRDAQ